MPYQGSTAASSVANPPVLIASGMTPYNSAAANVLGSSLQTTQPFNGGTQLWRYTSSDASTLAQAAGYFTDGLGLGMHIGDIIFIVAQTSLGTSPSMNVGVLVTTNSTAGFNVATGAAIASS
jgi:hypothetical protein